MYLKQEHKYEDHLSKSQSKDSNKPISAVGRPTVCKTMTIVTNPAEGIPAAPILAAVAVILIVMTWPMDKETPLSCAMKIADTASYNAVPSILIVAPEREFNLFDVV